MRRPSTRSFLARVCLVVAASGVSAPTLAQTAQAPPSAGSAHAGQAPSPAPAGNVVTGVRIDRQNVFDQSESTSWLAKGANALHIVTRDYVVRRELLIAEGAAFDSATAAETARNLRKLGIFREVSVDSARTAEGLEQQVTTRDAWSTMLYLSFKTVGDQVTWGVGVTEKNLLGSQIKTSIRYTKDPDRSTTQFSANVPRVWNLLGFDVNYNKLSDGKTSRFTASSPFTTTTTPRSATLDLEYQDKDVLRFFEGEEVASDTVRRLMTRGTLNAAWATRASRFGFFRVGTAVQARREDFGDSATIASGDRSVFGELGVNVETSQAKFKVIRGFRTLTGNEDVDVSRTLRGELWVAPNVWGYDRFGVGPALTAHVGKLFPNGFTTVDLIATSLFTSAGLDSGGVKGKVITALYPGPRQALILNVSGGVQRNPYPGEEFDLGLTYGPRGYPQHAFTGDRSFYTMAEYRWVAVPEVLDLFAVGLATFLDYGGAWYAGSPKRTGADTGVGLRIGSIRSSSGKGAARIDLVYRFANDVFGDGWLITLGSGFPFDRL
jgi:hypothetical protein